MRTNRLFGTIRDAPCRSLYPGHIIGKVERAMKKKTRKILSLFLSLTMASTLCLPAMAVEEEPTPADDGIVVLYTNDVHCTSDDGTAYAAIASYKAEMEASYGVSNVTLVDNGDAIQGAALGALSEGGWIVDIMNQVGYDLAIPGNHEFDFGMDTFLDIVANQADYSYLSCNFLDAEGQPVLDAWTMITYGDVDVAYVGISTPETMTKAAPAYFQNEDGEYIYSFCQGNEGQDLYDQVQATVDSAREAGADYVVAMAHLGEDAQSSPWMSTEVIANTTGIDVVLDGHSHTVEPSKLVENADGEQVLLSQTGTKAESIGKLVIGKDGTMTTELVPLADVDTTSQAYADADTFIKSIQEQYKSKTEEVVATSQVDLTVNDPVTGQRAVRSAETNLGDLCADAYRIMLGADIGWVNGGGVRADIAAGDVTYGDIIAVHPFGNMACLVEVTGQQILDALELGSMYVGTAENGGFLQVSGLKYTIDTSIPSSVELDDAGNFVQVAGDRRVSDVQVLDSETGAYAPIDPEATYSLASHNYMLKDGGDGYAMFGAKNITILQDEVMVDNEVLINYIKDELGGVIGEAYADPCGQGRITILYADADFSSWYGDAARFAIRSGIMSTTNGSDFSPSQEISLATLYQVLYNLADTPEVGTDTVTDTAGQWYDECVNWAASVGLYEGDTFGEDRAVTRAQTAHIIATAATYLGFPAPETGTGLADAPDYADIPAEYLAGVTYCYYAGIMVGNDLGQQMPNNVLTRAEFAQILLNLSSLIQ